MTTKAFIIFGLSAALFPTPTSAQQAEVTFTATSANVAQPGSPVTIRILRWSTDEERSPVVAALNPPAPAAAPVGAEAGGAARGGRAAAGRAGRGGRAGARGGRGDAVPPSPMASLKAAIGRAPTVGYIWTTDVTGYSIKYAWHASLPDGGERIILATDRRLGAHVPAWTPVAAPTGAEALAKAGLTDEEFTLIEMRLDSKGSGEAKTSLTAKVVVDNEARTVALENYDATPTMLQNVKAGGHGSPPGVARGVSDSRRVGGR